MLYEDIKQCYAPTKSGRCTKATIDDDHLHCQDHWPEHVKLYRKYKVISKITNSLDLKKMTYFSDIEKIKFINMCYCVCLREYDARNEHSKKCLVPEVVNFGHKKRIEIILERIAKYQKYLEQLYQKLNVKIENCKINQNVDEDTNDNNHNNNDVVAEMKTSLKNFETFKIKKANDVAETNKLINMFIKQNQKATKKKQLIIQKIFQVIDPLLLLNNCHKWNHFWTVTRILNLLYDIEYGQTNFTFPKCRCQFNCGLYDMFQIGFPECDNTLQQTWDSLLLLSYPFLESFLKKLDQSANFLQQRHLEVIKNYWTNNALNKLKWVPFITYNLAQTEIDVEFVPQTTLKRLFLKFHSKFSNHSMQIRTCLVQSDNRCKTIPIVTKHVTVYKYKFKTKKK